jgi:hypothetical protein
MSLQTHGLRQYFDPALATAAETVATAAFAPFVAHALAFSLAHARPLLTPIAAHARARTTFRAVPAAPRRAGVATLAAFVETTEEDLAQDQQAGGLPPGEHAPTGKAGHDRVPQEHHYRTYRGDRRQHEHRYEEAPLGVLPPVTLRRSVGGSGLVVLRVHLSS